MELGFLFPDRLEVEQDNFSGSSILLTLEGLLVLDGVDVDEGMKFFSGELFRELYGFLLGKELRSCR